MVMAEGVPAPQPGMTYQTWAYDAQGNPRPAGTWTPDDAGHAAAHVDSLTRDCTALSVTLEPSGGSPRPTGEPLAMVQLA
jgi:anti-sigma-K factor RskA